MVVAFVPPLSYSILITKAHEMDTGNFCNINHFTWITS